MVKKRYTYLIIAHAGNTIGSISKIAVPINQVASEMTITPKRFNINPFRAISITLNLPDPNTMALGGVATGSINAHDAATVAGTIKKNGCSPMAIAVAPKMGRIMVAIAVFEMTSVKKMVAETTMKMITIIGIP